MRKLRPKYGGRGVRISLEIRHDRVYEPHALLALRKGGFGVEVVDGARTRIVPVRTGMFAAGQVEVSGKGIVAGMRVGVPK
jgi:multidrug efflux pump subunit AcrA (membrane-fusion protein)